MPSIDQHPNFATFLSTLSEHRAPVVFWIGAGVSADAKLPGWAKLREIFVEAALEELVSRPADEADRLEADLEQAEITTDLWEAFETVKEILGKPAYNASIRRNLGPSETVPIPELHKLIWELEATRGIVSLNIDGLEGRAHQLTRAGEDIDVFFGRDLQNHLHSFREKRPFIARLHGHHSDSTSWVFTKVELERQLRKESYKTSVQSLFSNFTVIFLGISADDIAAGGFLEVMTESGVDSGNHFWITDRNDIQTREWSDRAGILRVPYTVGENENHTSVIRSMLEKVKSHTSKDSLSIPISYSGEIRETIPELKVLKTMDEDEVRLALNAYAKHLLDEGANCTDTRSYQEFLASYSPAIHQSWHLDLQQGYNKFFGYVAVERIHSGPFSTVWRVQDTEYNQYALKVMQLDNLKKGPQLDSFRRGIASQKLIRDTEEFTGIAKIEKAFEIPPSVIMEFIEGEDLEEVSQKADFDFWSDGIQILINLCIEIERAHKSKFGILHRDIRPSNVMIPNYYLGDSAVDHGLDLHAVKILNYDMTWHKDASGKVAPVSKTSAGYYSPELLNEPDSSRARDARVDSYGMGMTIARISTGKPPPVEGSKSHEWFSYLETVRKARNVWFDPAHNYLQRIIEGATQSIPQDRTLIGDVLVKLRILKGAIIDEVDAVNLTIMAEKLMYSVCGDNYQVNLRGNVFTRQLDGYRSYQIESCQNPDVIKLLFTNSQTDGANWSRIDQPWKSKLRMAEEILQSGGWISLENSGYSQRVITLSAKITRDKLIANFEKAQDALSKAITKVQID